MIEIAVTPVANGRFEARIGNEVLCRSRTPLLSAARELLRRGLSEGTDLAMRHEGMIAMRTTVGVAAGLTVKEPDKGSPRFARYEAPPFSPVSRNSADRGGDASQEPPTETAAGGATAAEIGHPA